MRKLILATESFPYGKGESSFILPELERWRRHFEVIILSHANCEQQKEGITGEVPEGVKVICLGRPQLSVFDKCKAVACFLLDREGRTEIREILRERTDVKERLYQSISFYAQALADRKEWRQSGILCAEETMIYYSFWYSYFCYSMAREKRRYPDMYLVTRAHGIDLYHERIPGSRQPFRHQMERRLDAIIFACEYAAQYYKAHVMGDQVGEDVLHVCKLGTERPRRQMPINQREERELLSCSGMVPLKRIHLIIDGLARVEGLKIHWTHIGDGEEMQRLLAYAERMLGGKDNVRYTFKGYVENVRAYYEHNQVDCFITTSKTEGGCPVSIQEAMSYGVPVIGTDVGGITEMIAANGILLPAEPTAAGIAEAIRKILTQGRRELQEMKLASYQKWAAEFDIDTCFIKIYEIFKELDL